MDPLALLQAFNDSETEQPEPKKEKKKKKISPAAMRKLQMKLAEEARQNVIKQKQDYLRQTKVRVQEEWERNHEKAEIYEGEFQKRYEQLQRSFRRLGEIENAWEQLTQERRKFEEWEQYTKCDGLPNPTLMPEMNSYIFEWTELESNIDMDYCKKKTAEVMKLLDGLQKIIKNPAPETPVEFLKDIKELRERFRDLLQANINKAIYYLFSRLETDMESINVTTSKYFAECPYFQINLWAELYTPYPSPGKETTLPLKVYFEEVDVVVVLPAILVQIHKVMRAIWFKYDHWSDKCRTFDCPPLPSYFKFNLLELFLSENDEKVEIMNSRQILELKMKKRIAAIPPEPTLSQEIFAWESEPQRTLSEEITYRECAEEDELEQQVLAMLNEFEVNLRRRRFLGDLLLVELLHVPPQPKYLRFKHNVTLREESPELKPVDYYVKFPPVVEEEAEESEEEEGAHEMREFISTRRFFKEEKVDPEVEERKKLVTIQIKPMPWVVWYETPEVAGWDPVHEYWSSEDIHDLTYDEEDGVLGVSSKKFRTLLNSGSTFAVLMRLSVFHYFYSGSCEIRFMTLTFKTGRLGVFGLHVNRYCLFPYENWFFEGNDEGGVNFYLKTAKSEFNFKIKEGQVCLESMKDVPSKAMNWILENYYSPKELKEVNFKSDNSVESLEAVERLKRQLLQKGGIDVFPEPDGSAYVDEILSKHVVIENNIYQVWGLFSKKLRFRKSKFNQAAGRGRFVFQAQETYKDRQMNFCLIQTGMCSCYVLDIYEDDEIFSLSPAPHMKSSIDLHTLLRDNCTMDARREADVASFLLVQTVREFLSLVRPLSFS